MTTIRECTYICPSCGNEIDFSIMTSTSSSCWPDHKVPTDAFTKANPEEIGCRACGIFFLREKAEERERTRFRQSSEYEELEIPAFIRDRMLTPEERMTEEIRKLRFPVFRNTD